MFEVGGRGPKIVEGRKGKMPAVVSQFETGRLFVGEPLSSSNRYANGGPGTTAEDQPCGCYRNRGPVKRPKAHARKR